MYVYVASDSWLFVEYDRIKDGQIFYFHLGERTEEFIKGKIKVPLQFNSKRMIIPESKFLGFKEE